MAPLEQEKKTPKSKPIRIEINLFRKTEEEYDLKKNFFDPNKHSPPNEFMMKLYKRFQELKEETHSEEGFVSDK